MEILLREFLEKILLELKIDLDNFEIETDENSVKIRIKTKDSGFLIGPHGVNLEVFKKVVQLFLVNNFGEAKRIFLEVNDYIDSKDSFLIKRVKIGLLDLERNGKEVTLDGLNSYERKKVHDFIQNFDGKYYSKSTGEGSSRKLHIGLNGNLLNIDLDSSGI